MFRHPRSVGAIGQGGIDDSPQASAVSPAATTGSSQAPASSGPSVNIQDFSAILFRRWRLIVATTAITTILGGTASFLFTPKFTATTSIFVDPRSRASFQIEGSGTGAGYDPNLVDSQTLVIESDAVLRRVIETENLSMDSEFAQGTGEATANALRNLKEAVKVRRPDRTYVVEIQVRTRESEKSARIANAIARAYLNDGRDAKSETVQREQSWLDTHLVNLQARLKEAEAEVETYKKANRILGVEGRLIGEQQLSELNRGIVEAQRRAAEAKAVLDQMDILRKSGRLPDSTTEALRSGAIERLRTQLAEVMRLEANSRSTLGPRHPAAIEIREQIVELRRLINEELSRITENARTAHAVAISNVAELTRQLDMSKREQTDINGKLLRLRELERAVDAQKAVYEKFLRDKEQIARLTIDTPAGRVIEPAIAPLYRSFPNRPLILALSFVVGAFLGVALALLREMIAGARGLATRARNPKTGFRAIAKHDRPANNDDVPVSLLPARGNTKAVRWVGTPANSNAAAPDLMLREPGSAYAKEVFELARKLFDQFDGKPEGTLLVTGHSENNARFCFTVDLAHALSALGTKVLINNVSEADKHVPRSRGNNAKPVTISFAGSLRQALALGRGATSPFLLTGANQRSDRTQPAERIHHCAIVLVNIPERKLNSRMLRQADGILVLLPQTGSGQTALTIRDLEEKYGDTLMGVIRQAA